MKILVTGATGLIGGALCGQLSDEGHEVATVSRRAQSSGRFPVIRWDPLEGPVPAAAVDGCDAVIHLAGEPVAGGRWTPEIKRRIRDSRVIGTRNLIAGFRATSQPPRILLSASAVGYYGSRGDEILDETSKPGAGFLPEVSIEWEREAQAAAELGVRVVQVRIGVVLAREGGALPKMLPAFRLGIAGNLGDGRQWFPWIHQADTVGIIRHALLNDAVRGPINAVAPDIVTNAEFTKALGRALKRPTFFSAPAFALSLVLGEMAEVVLASQRVLPHVAEATGYRFRFPGLEEALKDLL
ncbi:MAG: TIGR01777 family oxidoreductase [Blastocatellales bacterium]|nr:TIGR01777 family oxidoreductase [Blastocatellales bacterium]